MTMLDDARTRTDLAAPGPTVPAPIHAKPAAAVIARPAARAPEPTARRRWRFTLGRGTNPALRTIEEHARAQARAFCWAWLLFAMVGSVSGNVLHAWMTAPAALRLGAAVAAIFPPLLLLGATHLVALLISTRRRQYRVIDLVVLVVVMLGAIGVAVFAFTISFYALRDLMVLFGQGSNVAWRWPIAVDLSLIVSSLAMLSLTEARITRSMEAEANSESYDAPAGAEHGEPARPTARRLWWESIAAEVREELIDTRNIADLTPQRLGEILERMYDRSESDRGIRDYTRLRQKEVGAIREAADGVLARTPAADERQRSSAG
ncbi:hypothetical protein BKG82_12690 [Mycobacteroides chelonae]|uniref:DUF2637 domain-containing protein n=1 Tax=Mycobacteroides chelonae TaxID=1774 RepID=A0A1S1LNN0_MYCCH|nr:DUF2637 domain-containing protein [Mycobacteroides chelonae]OHU57044.1 hypothetical protein BKG82_12690 [Mycobacteroides chelonae]